MQRVYNKSLFAKREQTYDRIEYTNKRWSSLAVKNKKLKK